MGAKEDQERIEEIQARVSVWASFGVWCANLFRSLKSVFSKGV